MAGEFFSSEACCSSCHNRILQKNRDKEKKERELAVQKQRREQRKKEQKEAKIEIEKSQQKQPIIKQVCFHKKYFLLSASSLNVGTNSETKNTEIVCH